MVSLVNGRYLQGFAMPQQIPWVEQSKCPNIALWLRLAFLAFGTRGKSGHAPFYNWKEIAEQTTPYGRPEASARQVRRAIADAISRGFLSTKSNHRCLVDRKSVV